MKRGADIGIAGGRGRGIVFKKGKMIGTYDEADLLGVLLEEVSRMTGEVLDGLL